MIEGINNEGHSIIIENVCTGITETYIIPGTFEEINIIINKWLNGKSNIRVFCDCHIIQNENNTDENVNVLVRGMLYINPIKNIHEYVISIGSITYSIIYYSQENMMNCSYVQSTSYIH